LSRVSTPFHRHFAELMGVDGRDKPGQDDEISHFEIWIRSPGHLGWRFALFSPPRYDPPRRWKMASTKALLEAKRDEILKLAALHGAANVRVFGSVARGDDREDSDIDLLVHMEDGRSLFDLVRFWTGVSTLLEREVDVVDDGSLSPYVKDRVLADARAL
jgi:predicted nucleotidyltransferase